MSSTRESTLSFNIELHSREHVKRVSMPDGERDRLTIGGSLGKLKMIELIEDILLIVSGENGTLRIEIKREELEKCLKVRTKRVGKLGVGGAGPS
jgi:hypothetical protein